MPETSDTPRPDEPKESMACSGPCDSGCSCDTGGTDGGCPLCAGGWIPGILGALAGGVLGHVLFFWAAGQGFYAPALPGIGVGLLGGWMMKRNSRAFGVVCAVLALAFELGTEWKISVATSFWEFLTFIPHFPKITLLLLAFGVACGYWFGRGRCQA